MRTSFHTYFTALENHLFIFGNTLEQHKLEFDCAFITVSECWRFFCLLPWASSCNSFEGQQEREKNAISYHVNGKSLENYNVSTDLK